MTRDVVVGFDGTGQKWEDNTNVARVLRAAEVAGHLTFYFPGVGTKWYNRVRGGVGGARTLETLGDALELVSDAYHVNNTDVRIWIVGYSRGGASAIAFSNLLFEVGVGRRIARPHVREEALNVIGARAGYRATRCRDFRRRHNTTRPDVHFVGCFDPVGALGLGIPRELARAWFGSLDLRVAPNVKHYFSLLALDEHRRFFQPIMQDRRNGNQVLQKWVPGCHGDIGGGERQPVAEYTVNDMLIYMSYDLTGIQPKIVDFNDCIQDTTSFHGLHRLPGKVNRRIGLGFPGERKSTLARFWQANLLAAGRPWGDIDDLPC